MVGTTRPGLARKLQVMPYEPQTRLHVSNGYSHAQECSIVSAVLKYVAARLLFCALANRLARRIVGAVRLGRVSLFTVVVIFVEGIKERPMYACPTHPSVFTEKQPNWLADQGGGHQGLGSIMVQQLSVERPGSTKDSTYRSFEVCRHGSRPCSSERENALDLGIKWNQLSQRTL